jgi:ribosome-associated translation inhibitor RaiA
MRVTSGTGVAPSMVMTNMTARQQPSPSVTLDVSGLPITETVRNRVARRIRRALVGVRTTPIDVHVTFADVNGPKGGADIRCAIDVRIPRTAPIHAEACASRDFTAFDRSVAVITRRIAQRLRRRQASQRRPKKYYAAKRLI